MAKRPLLESVVEHIEYRAGASEHGALVAAFAEARRLLLAARGFRSVDVTRGAGDESEYRVRIEWRSSADQAAFAASDGAVALERTMAAFERRGRHVGRPIDIDRGDAEFDSSELRRSFGHYPTGVAVITAAGPDGPAGMVVSSFTTVSLRPALVAFCAGHTSTTWPVIADARSCCINVVAASQAELCQKLVTKADPRFETIAWSAAPSGAPIVAGAVGWLDCHIVEVRRAGDHDLVLLEVLAHDAQPDLEPLLFHRSAYRTLASPTTEKDDG